MKSPLGFLFLAIRQKLISLQDGNGERLLPFVDRNFQQLNFDKPPVKFPCALIGGMNFNTQQLTENAQKGTGSITIMLAFTPFSSASSLKDDEYVEKAIAYFDIEQTIHEALQGWHPAWMDGDTDLLGSYAGSLARTGMREMPRNDDIIVREITYSLGIDDFTTKKVRGTTTRPNFTLSTT